MRKCHFCKLTIADAARVCPHCGKDLTHGVDTNNRLRLAAFAVLAVIILVVVVLTTWPAHQRPSVAITGYDGKPLRTCAVMNEELRQIAARGDVAGVVALSKWVTANEDRMRAMGCVK